MKVNQPCVLITGGSGSIGSACAMAFAKLGYHIFINYVSRGERAEKVCSAIIAAGGSAIPIQADVSIATAVEDMFNRISSISPELACIVNCAGVIIRPSAISEISELDWLKTLNVNLGGVLNCSRHGASSLSRHQGGAIVNIGSIFGSALGAPAVGVYAAAKAGVLSLTKSFARSLGPAVRVNCVLPGVIDTEMSESSPDQVKRDYIERTVLKRLGQAEEVAAAILFLARASYITGQALVVDGGYSVS